MALVTLPGNLWLPRPRIRVDSQSFINFAFSGVGNRQRWIIEAPKTGNVSKVLFRTGSQTITGDGEIRLEGVNTSTGDADGTLINASAKAAVNILSSDDNKIFVVALDAAIAVLRGDSIAVVFKNDATTPMTGEFTGWADSSYEANFPYQIDQGDSKFDRGLILAFEYDDGSYEPMGNTYPVQALSAAPFAADDTPDERALRFKLPVRVRTIGFWGEFGYQSSGVGEVVLYDDADVELDSVALDRDIRVAAGGTGAEFHFWPNDQHTLEANKVHRLSWRAVSTGANKILVQQLEFDKNATLDAMDGGKEFYLSTRTDLGSFTDDTAKRPFMGLVLDQIDAAGSGGAVGLLGGTTGGRQ